MKQNYPSFQQITHTADLALQVFGVTLEELFTHALQGMFSVIEPHFTANAQEITRTMQVHGTDLETLLVNFLAECLYLSDTHNEAYTDARIQIQDTDHGKLLQATIIGKQIEKFEVVEIKAVTYHDLHIVQENGIWKATVVFDI